MSPARAPGRRRSSLILRYLVGYAATFALLVFVVLALASWTTIGRHEEQADSAIQEEARRLRGELVGRSETQMAAVVTRSSASGGRRTLYMLATERREYLAGNVPTWPDVAEGRTNAENGELQEFALPAGSAATQARGTAIVLPSGHRLLVARDLSEAAALRRVVIVSLLATLAVTVLLGVGGGVVLSRRLSARLEDLSRNSDAILDGDLSRRMPVSSRGDEFDALAESLNRMLDRIEQLMDGMRAVSESIAHDLRSPISRMRSRIEVALMQPPDAQAYGDVLRQTIRDVDAVLGMFNALLTIALAESGAPRERFADVDLKALAADVVETFEPVAEEAGLRLALEASDGPAIVRGERQLLAQALGNLLDNAVKYVPSGGRVTVRVRPGDASTRLEVADDGPGVPAEFRARAFERFTRVETSRTTPGSGLGLSLVRAVARLHGGDVTLGDASPGLVVGIELPR